MVRAGHGTYEFLRQIYEPDRKEWRREFLKNKNIDPPLSDEALDQLHRDSGRVSHEFSLAGDNATFAEIAEKSIDWNEAEEITTRLAVQVKPDAVVRTPDGQIDLVATAIEKLRKSDGIIETDLVFREATPSEQKLIAESESLRKAWTKEIDHVGYYKTYVIFLWAIIIFLLFLVVILKASK